MAGMRFGIVLLLLASLGACAKKAPKITAIAIVQAGPASHPTGVEGLVPADAPAILRFASLDRVRAWHALGERVSGLPLGSIDDLLRRVDVSKVESSLPLYSVLRMDELGNKTLVLPAKPDAATGEYGLVYGGGDYTAFSDDTERKGGVNRLLDGMLDADISARINLEQLIETRGEELDSFFEGMGEGMGMFIPKAESMLGVVKDVVKGSRQLDVTANLADGNVDIQFVYERNVGEKDGSTRLADLVARMPDDPFLFAAKMDLAALNRFMAPVTDQSANMMTEERAAAFRKQMRESNRLAELLQGEFAVTLDLSAKGFRIAMASRSNKPQAYVDGYVAMMSTSEGLGWDLKDAGTHKVGGVSVHRLEGRFDMKAAMGDQVPPPLRAMMSMFSTDIVVELAIDGDIVWLTMDRSGAHMARALEGDGKLSPLVAPAVERMGGELRMLLLIDLRNLTAGISAMAPLGKTIDYGRPLPITLYGGGDGISYHGGATANVEQCAAFIKSLLSPQR